MGGRLVAQIETLVIAFLSKKPGPKPKPKTRGWNQNGPKYPILKGTSTCIACAADGINALAKSGFPSTHIRPETIMTVWFAHPSITSWASEPVSSLLC